MKKIKGALISVYYKDGLEQIVRKLAEDGVTIYSTGGTLSFIEGLGLKAVSVESLTGYPSILGGRVKTLHPKVFGGILSRRDNPQDAEQTAQYEIPEIDAVIVDLYPFEQTVASGAEEQAVIEKIDIGGISLIRAAAKNFKDVVIVPSVDQYAEFYEIITAQQCATTLEQRRRFAAYAFDVSSHYDSAIFNYFNRQEQIGSFKLSFNGGTPLRYGENPHQSAVFYGDLERLFDKLHGKDISYNNMLDIDAAINLIEEFDEPTFVIMKHNNACGVATRPTLSEAWKDALAGDPVSAFGGVLICNREVDATTAEEINKLFFEVILAPSYTDEALAVLECKKNRIILRLKDTTRCPFAAERRSGAGSRPESRRRRRRTALRDRETGRARTAQRLDLREQDRKTFQEQRDRTGQGRYADRQRHRPNLARGCAETGHRESQKFRVRPDGGRDGVGCVLPVRRLRRNRPQGGHRRRDSAGRLGTRPGEHRLLQRERHGNVVHRSQTFQALTNPLTIKT